MHYTLRTAMVLSFFIYSFFETQSQKLISVEDFTIKNTFELKTITGINWMKNGKFYTTLEGNKIVRYNISTGKAEETILDGSAMSPSISIESYSFSQDEKKLLLLTAKKSIYRRSYVGEYYVYDLLMKSLERLSEAGKQSYATFSPDGTRVAFVRSNNLFYTSLGDKKEVQVTDDGKFNFVINGTTDWVYEEEFSFVVGFFWAPDGKKLAYYRFDESAVKEYNMQVWGKGSYPVDYKFKYPKAGERNSEVEIWIYDLDSRKKVKSDLGQEKDIYVPRVSWTNSADVLSIRKLNRLQNDSELIHVDVKTGSAKVVHKEKSETYVDVESLDELIYLSDGRHFIAANESNGHKHLSLYTLEGRLVHQITNGNFDVMSLVGYDEKGKNVYYVAADPSPLQRQFFAVSLDGKRKVRLSKEKGQHSINMSSDFQFYMDHFNSGDTPTQATLYQTKGNKAMKTLEKNDELKENINDFGIVAKEFFSYKTIDGTELNGYYLKPANFVPGKKYPLMLYQYSGPNSQNAGDNFAGSHFYFHQLLTQKDIVVAVVDPRGTGARGEKFKKITYKQLGKLELEDLVAAGKFFREQPFIDGNRMGIWGWSYGGYMTALAMTKGEGIFKMGIAVSPVTNWRFYDTVYTERFLQTPELNASGYDDNSPLTHAASLQGKFLLVHGTGDDNVHFQNSVLFEKALIHAGKQFRSFYYPDKHHGIQGAKTRFHLYTMMQEFIMENL